MNRTAGAKGPDGRPGKLRTGAAVLLCAALLAGPAGAALTRAEEERTGSRSRTRVNAGFCMNIFSSVDPRDIEVALEVMMKRFIERIQPDYEYQVFFLDDPAEMESFITEHDIHLINMLSTDYLAIRDRIPLTPRYVPALSGKPTQTYVLLVRRDSGIEGLADLAGKRILVSSTGKGAIALLWLDTLLMRHGHQPSHSFFGRMELLDKASRAVMPVFFSQADAAVVSRSSLQVMAELNPQIETRLTVLETSPELLAHATCFVGEVDPGIEDLVDYYIDEITNDPEGQQVLTVFQVKAMVPFVPEYLAAIESIYAEHDRLERALEEQEQSGSR